MRYLLLYLLILLFVCFLSLLYFFLFFFFFNDTATTEIYTLSLHDALPISGIVDQRIQAAKYRIHFVNHGLDRGVIRDRKSTRLNSSHEWISYAVFCLKKKKKKKNRISTTIKKINDT